MEEELCASGKAPCKFDFFLNNVLTLCCFRPFLTLGLVETGDFSSPLALVLSPLAFLPPPSTSTTAGLLHVSCANRLP